MRVVKTYNYATKEYNPKEVIGEPPPIKIDTNLGCSIRLVVGFPFDNPKDEWNKKLLQYLTPEKIIEEIEKDRFYKTVGYLIAVSDKQSQAAEIIKRAGFELLGVCKGAHPDESENSAKEMYLFGKGFIKP